MTSTTAITLRRKVIQHPQFQYLRLRLEETYEECKITGIGKGIVIVGPSGVGKTTLLKAFTAGFKASCGSVRAQKIVIVDVPSSPTPKSLASAILAGMGDPFAFSARHSAEEKAVRIQKLFTELGAEILILDEGQHLADRSKRLQYQAADWLKNLLNITKVMVVITGLPRLVSFLHSNEQLRRRFSASHSYLPFDSADPNSMKNFAGVLHAIQSQIGMKCISFTSPDVLRRFYMASHGLVDYIIKVIDRAISIASASQENDLHLGILAMAFKDEIWSTAPSTRNPFDPSFDMRPLTFSGEPFEGYIDGVAY